MIAFGVCNPRDVGFSGVKIDILFEDRVRECVALRTLIAGLELVSLASRALVDNAVVVIVHVVGLDTVDEVEHPFGVFDEVNGACFDHVVCAFTFAMLALKVVLAVRVGSRFVADAAGDVVDVDHIQEAGVSICFCKGSSDNVSTAWAL